MNGNNRKIITILSLFTIIFTLMGGTLAYWTWTSDTHTGVAFTISKEFSCSADGGQDLTSTNIALQPTADCTNSEVALKRTIKVTQNIEKPGLNVNLDMWLKVNDIDPELAASDNLMYAISTVEGSCKKGMDGYINGGNFKGLTTNSQAILLKNKTYTSTTTDTYYLYIWLDAAETNSNTMDKSFDLSLGGICTDTPAPEAPVLDDGMIPVTIANDGTVTMVSEEDPSWYNYGNKEWANVVLVSEDGGGAEESRTREYYQNPENIGEMVTQEDILAYYVWIPRYKYRIPRIKCSDIENPNPSTHSSCYTGPVELLISEEEFIKRVAYYFVASDGWCEHNEEYWETGKGEEYICAEEDWPYILSEAQIYAEELLSDGVTSSFRHSNEPIYYVLDDNEFTMKFNKNNFWDRGPETIDIEFEVKEKDMVLGNATTQYRTHPAFWWDDDSDDVLDNGELLSGIWVGKFESNSEKNNNCYDALKNYKSTNDYLNICNYSTQNPTILPNEVPLIYQNVSNQFYTSRNIGKEGNIYGLDNNTINAHMMKNRDWGAVAYLSHSEYGKNSKVENNVYSRLTGCYSNNPNSCSKTYGILEVYPQSTTGNISGIFDIAGGYEEYVMGHYGTTININNNDYSGFTQMPELKYYDLYSQDVFVGESTENIGYCTLETCGGHALNETIGWYYENYNVYNYYFPFVEKNQRWFLRGNKYGSIFESDAEWGYVTSSYNYSDKAWRSVLVPGFSH